jgi:hypothetical protein
MSPSRWLAVAYNATSGDVISEPLTLLSAACDDSAHNKERCLAAD